MAMIGCNLRVPVCGTGYEDAASDIARVLNEAATERAQAAYEQQLTEELQKAANDIHYGNAHAGIHVTIHRVQEISDRLDPAV